MSFVERVSNYLAILVALKVPNTKYPTKEDQIEVFAYGWMLPIGVLYKGILLICFSIILGILTNNMFNAITSVLCITLTFALLRVVAAGGYHMSTYNGCLIISYTQFIGFALMILITFQYWTQLLIWSLLMLCLFLGVYVSIRYAPRDSPNNRITDTSQINKLKRWSLYFLLTWTILMTIFIFFNLKLIVISSCFGLLLELFSVSKLGQIFYIFLDNRTTKTTNNQQP